MIIKIIMKFIDDNGLLFMILLSNTSMENVSIIKNEIILTINQNKIYFFPRFSLLIIVGSPQTDDIRHHNTPKSRNNTMAQPTV